MTKTDEGGVNKSIANSTINAFCGILATPGQSRELDRSAIREYGIPGLILMENAASAIAGYITSHIGDFLAPGAERRALVACGKGNNGGDGFAVARKLHLKKFGVLILSLAARDEISGDSRTNMEICERLGIDIIFAPGESIRDILPYCTARAEFVVDAIFGTGFHGRPENAYEIAINAINEMNKPVFAVDAPSGLDCNTGVASGACVRADVTLALGLLKTGLITGPDTALTGRIELLDIGLPGELIEKTAQDTVLTDKLTVVSKFNVRKRTAHKGDFGRIIIVTGSPGMTGAGCLAADAALTAGAGLVYLAVPGSLAQIYETSVREAITLCAGSNVGRTISYESAEAIANYAGRTDAVAIGPGMSTDQDAAKAIRKIISSIQKPMVIDADALTAVASDLSVLKRLNAPAILTPHEGEMARLLGTSAANISANRLMVAREFASNHKVTLVLKGHRSIIASPDGRAFVNTTGNPGMATAGAGDVLTGMIAGFLGAGIAPTDAAIAAVYLHGLSGDIAAAKLGERSTRATDLIRCLPDAFISLGIS